MSEIAALGIAWYREEDYQTLLGIFTDAELLPATYREWLRRAEKLELKEKLAGRAVVRAYIDPHTFPDWCRERGLNVDAKGRMAFANEVAYGRTKRLDG